MKISIYAGDVGRRVIDGGVQPKLMDQTGIEHLNVLGTCLNLAILWLPPTMAPSAPLETPMALKKVLAMITPVERKKRSGHEPVHVLPLV